MFGPRDYVVVKPNVSVGEDPRPGTGVKAFVFAPSFAAVDEPDVRTS